METKVNADPSNKTSPQSSWRSARFERDFVQLVAANSSILRLAKQAFIASHNAAQLFSHIAKNFSHKLRNYALAREKKCRSRVSLNVKHMQ